MDEITKFLLKLHKKERQYLQSIIFPKIRDLKLKGLSIKKISGFSLWRIRHGKIRIIFAKINGKGVLVRIGFRGGDIYKNLK
ncbi:hypothetical protein KKF04_05315 [Patescibacteria group bacterium]|nr:hypothetical protein [Patescibacteria group bacterium]MBU1935449.1 hypothetical protein [Patescibacteria group bacterium]